MGRLLKGYLLDTGHRVVGLAYLITGFVMFLAGLGIMGLMRWQAAYPGRPLPLVGGLFPPDHPWLPGGVLLPNFYNQLGAMHGTTMVFLAVVPMLVGGFGTYLVPLMLRAPNLAFPRLSRLGFWCYLAGIAVIYASFFTRGGPANTGWTSYPPLSVIESAGQSFWLVGIVCVYFSSMLLSVNLIVTIVQRRPEGLGFMQLPFFVWTQLVTAFLLLLAFPPLAAAGLLQLSDRLLGTSFFLPSGLVVAGQTLDASGGGSALLWQHLFWFLAHPEVYVLILPAMGMVGAILPANTGRPLYGYRGMVHAVLFMGGMSFLVWAHHMYLTGMGAGMSRFFQATTIIISVPSVIIGGSLVLSLWGGAIRFTPPMCYALAFLPMFGIGGFTGLPLAMPSTNIQLHDTTYVVGHFHYIVVLGTLFAVFGAVAHWFPLVTGRLLGRRLALAHFALSLLFLNGVFFPLMLQGLAGVSRRLYDGGASYAHGQEVFFLNKAVTHSVFAFALVQLLFLANVVWSLRRGQPAGDNPWDSDSPEWGPSPAHAPDPFAHLPRPDTGLSSARLGMILFLAAEAMCFGALFSSYAFLRTAAGYWPTGGAGLPLGLNALALLALAMGGLAAWRAWRNPNRARRHSAAAAAWGALALVITAAAFHRAIHDAGPPAASTFLAIYYVLAAVTALHVLAATLASLGLALRPAPADRAACVARTSNIALFWAFTVLAGLVCYGLYGLG